MENVSIKEGMALQHAKTNQIIRLYSTEMFMPVNAALQNWKFCILAYPNY